ncbi:2-succinyl-6-hydroxy-2,4-cyclohexadiene-1-carboxylate synthase [Neobacillus dielmonensis]|uniref:2-succinyl-6-hydroxy-2, 4-cyclohexadiene-1-carboxylate synthase n=1 Tax=Neobacillus dielmonensis TaxID=1347369 RepID=UPI0005A8DB87|nr:2-succinyl-6-hydroxy-2,4-cyclohexadiene-1-carboxylate synthase [Neobacillus dielmonensis]
MIVPIQSIFYHVEVCGNGTPFVLLHGFTGDSSTWAPFSNRWGGDRQLIIPDIIGHGQTEAPNDLHLYNIESAAYQLNCLLDQLGISKTDMLGYSMGGRLALTFSILYPNKIGKLVLESTSPGLKTEDEREARRKNDAELAKKIREKGLEEFVNHWEKIPLFHSMEQLPDETRLKIRQQRLGNSVEGLTNSLIGMGTGSQPSWWNHLQELTSEVLLVTGEKDEKFCRIAKQMLPHLKNGKWITVENAGHAIHVEEPEFFGTIISDFLSNKT